MRKKAMVILLMGLSMPAANAAGFFDMLTGGSGAAAQDSKTESTDKCFKDKKGKWSEGCAKQVTIQAKSTRPLKELDKLFQGQEISGADLTAELKAIRASAATGQLNLAMNSLMGVAANPAAFQSGGFLSGVFSGAADILLDMLVSEMSYTALDMFFSEMSSNKSLLSDIKIKIPKSDQLTPELKQQVATLAAFLVAIKASGLVMDASQKDFDSAKLSYMNVLSQREQAAKLLGEAMLQSEGLAAAEQEEQARNVGLLSPEQRSYLDSFRDKKPEELLHDFSAQNIALEYLRKKDPGAFKNYRDEVQKFSGYYGAYVRTSVGAASMLGFSAIFLKRIKSIVEKQQVQAAAPVISLAGDGIKEALALGGRLSNVFAGSDEMLEGSFSLVKDGKKYKTGLSASKVFDKLDGDDLKTFRNSLIRDGKPGYLYQLYLRNPEASGQWLDATVEAKQRTEFVKNYFQNEDWPDFSFQNVFSLKSKLKDKRDLANDVIRFPAKSDDATDEAKSLTAIQAGLLKNLDKVGNTDLRRLVFANNEGSSNDPKLMLGMTEVKIESPGMKGVAEYEEMVMVGLNAATTRKVSPGNKAPKTKKVKL